jgi:hypothetical protein
VNPPEEATFHAIHGINKLVELHGKSMLSTTILILQEMSRVGSGLVEGMLKRGSLTLTPDYHESVPEMASLAGPLSGSRRNLEVPLLQTLVFPVPKS